MAQPGLPFAFARDHQVALDGDRLLIGPAPSMTGLREARRRAAHALTPERLDEAAFVSALATLYDRPSADEGEDDVIFELEDGQGNLEARDLLEDSTDAPVIRLVNQLLRQAVRNAASDLHIEPHETGLRARLRIDGTLQTVFDRRDVPGKRVVSRLKVMAGLDIAETRLPQDGRIGLRLGGRAVDVRMSTLPGNHGERVVLRLLDRSGGLMALDRLGLSTAQQTQLNRLAAQPNGLILATGPTGSGKTTSLYSLLKLADRSERNIITVEDPVEYDLPGISQCQVNSEIGMSFARGLRSVLRQDPDVILVGEIRDAETARVAAEAALTGHLVFSSLHANNPLSTIVRLRELGLENFLISATLRGVLAQRLVRRLCMSCRRQTAADDQTSAVFAQYALTPPTHVWQPTGCSECEGTGFSGRVGLYEIVEIGTELQQAIDAGASEQQMRSLGVTTDAALIRAGLERVGSGETSLDELRRVLGQIE